MADLFDYLLWRGDLSFAQVPPNAVDALIFSALSYIRFGADVESSPDTPILLSKAFEDLTSLPDFEDRIRVKKDLELLEAVSQSPRFSNCKIYQYRDILIREEETQFAAITFLLDDGSAFLAFRGTDYTLTGWKEDFNMFFRSVIPGHISAVHYLQTVAARLPGKLYLGGHSKGGNLALYGAAFAGREIQERIISVFNHDGPGLSNDIQRMPGYTDLCDKLHTTVPQASLFGLMFSSCGFQVVKSDRMGIMQHDPFSWEISGDDFIYAENLKSNANKLIFTIYDLMANLSRQDREVFIDTVFRVIAAPGVSSFTEWPVMAVKEFDSMVSTLKSIDEETAVKMKTVLAEFAKALGKNMFNLPDKEKIKQFIVEKVNTISKKDKL